VFTVRHRWQPTRKLPLSLAIVQDICSTFSSTVVPFYSATIFRDQNTIDLISSHRQERQTQKFLRKSFRCKVQRGKDGPCCHLQVSEENAFVFPTCAGTFTNLSRPLPSRTTMSSRLDGLGTNNSVGSDRNSKYSRRSRMVGIIFAPTRQHVALRAQRITWHWKVGL
jgi:hypothetical protein